MSSGPTPDILIANGVTTALCGSSTYVTDFFNGRIVRVNPKGKTRIVAEDEKLPRRRWHCAR